MPINPQNSFLSREPYIWWTKESSPQQACERFQARFGQWPAEIILPQSCAAHVDSSWFDNRGIKVRRAQINYICIGPINKGEETWERKDGIVVSSATKSEHTLSMMMARLRFQREKGHNTKSSW